MINARTKGARGEREFCKWLQKNLDLDFLPERNLDQVRNGGGDIIIPPFIFEVKRCQKLQLKKWWLQVKKASRKISNSIPVVCFRQNYKPWKFLIPSQSYGYQEIDEERFISWMRDIYIKYKAPMYFKN